MNNEAIGDMSFGQEAPREDRVVQRAAQVLPQSPQRPSAAPERLTGRRKVELL